MDLQHLRASDGTGEAVLAHIQTNRTIGSTVLDLDNVDNWNSKCVVVTGTPAANGFISPVGMKVMYGHLNAGDFIIDGYAPGYTDNGNTTAEVAIVKMTTSWADTLISLLGNALADTGFLKTTSLDHFFRPSNILQNDYVYSGGIVAQTAGLTGNFSDIVFYITGLRYSKTGVANKNYTASKDTYVDIDSTGTVYYTEVANGAASPALTAGRIRIAKVITSGAAITSILQTGATDSLGNYIRPTGLVSKAMLELPHHNALMFSTNGAGSGQVVGAVQVDANFDASETDAVGITASSLGSAPYLTIQRAGLYSIDMQATLVDASGAFNKSQLSWLYMSFDNGTTYTAIRNTDRTLYGNDGSSMQWNWKMVLPAGCRLRMQWFSNPGNSRFGAPSNVTGETAYQARRNRGSYLAVTEIR